MPQAYSPKTSTVGHIRWSYILHRNDVHTKNLLHAANRVTDKHVNFDSQEMKVSLAAQTLSGSVRSEGHWLCTVSTVQSNG